MDKRTSGMYALGIAHIVIGAIGLLASVLFAIGSALALVPQLVAFAGPSIVERATEHHRALIGFVVLALVRAAVAAVLIVAGLNVVVVSPAGRRFSIAAAYGWTLLNVIDAFAFQEPFWLFIANTAYPLFVECLFLQKSWRTAFQAPSMDVAELAAPHSHPIR